MRIFVATVATLALSGAGWAQSNVSPAGSLGATVSGSQGGGHGSGGSGSGSSGGGHGSGGSGSGSSGGGHGSGGSGSGGSGSGGSGSGGSLGGGHGSGGSGSSGGGHGSGGSGSGWNGNWNHGGWGPAGAAFNPNWQGYGRIALHGYQNYGGNWVMFQRSVPDLRRYNFDNKTRSIRVSGRWELCSGRNYTGRCVKTSVSRSQLNSMKLDRSVSSLRYLGR